jgi:exonuclease III
VNNTNFANIKDHKKTVKKVSNLTSLSNKPFAIFHQNIAGALNKVEELETAILELRADKTDIDVICLSETFIKKGEEQFLFLQNFKLASSYTRENKRGGSCILIRNNLDFEELTSIRHLTTEKVFEVCGIKIKSINIIIVCLYRTPDSNVETFLHLLEELLTILSHHSSKIVIAGDFNINFLGKSKHRVQIEELLSNYM